MFPNYKDRSYQLPSNGDANDDPIHNNKLDKLVQTQILNIKRESFCLGCIEFKILDMQWVQTPDLSHGVQVALSWSAILDKLMPTRTGFIRLPTDSQKRTYLPQSIFNIEFDCNERNCSVPEDRCSIFSAETSYSPRDYIRFHIRANILSFVEYIRAYKAKNVHLLIELFALESSLALGHGELFIPLEFIENLERHAALSPDIMICTPFRYTDRRQCYIKSDTRETLEAKVIVELNCLLFASSFDEPTPNVVVHVSVKDNELQLTGCKKFNTINCADLHDCQMSIAQRMSGNFGCPNIPLDYLFLHYIRKNCDYISNTIPGVSNWWIDYKTPLILASDIVSVLNGKYIELRHGLKVNEDCLNDGIIAVPAIQNDYTLVRNEPSMIANEAKPSGARTQTYVTILDRHLHIGDCKGNLPLPLRLLNFEIQYIYFPKYIFQTQNRNTVNVHPEEIRFFIDGAIIFKGCIQWITQNFFGFKFAADTIPLPKFRIKQQSSKLSYAQLRVLYSNHIILRIGWYGILNTEERYIFGLAVLPLQPFIDFHTRSGLNCKPSQHMHGTMNIKIPGVKCVQGYVGYYLCCQLSVPKTLNVVHSVQYTERHRNLRINLAKARRSHNHLQKRHSSHCEFLDDARELQIDMSRELLAAKYALYLVFNKHNNAESNVLGTKLLRRGRIIKEWSRTFTERMEINDEEYNRVFEKVIGEVTGSDNAEEVEFQRKILKPILKNALANGNFIINGGNEIFLINNTSATSEISNAIFETTASAAKLANNSNAMVDSIMGNINKINHQINKKEPVITTNNKTSITSPTNASESTKPTVSKPITASFGTNINDNTTDNTNDANDNNTNNINNNNSNNTNQANNAENTAVKTNGTTQKLLINGDKKKRKPRGRLIQADSAKSQEIHAKIVKVLQRRKKESDYLKKSGNVVNETVIPSIAITSTTTTTPIITTTTFTNTTTTPTIITKMTSTSNGKLESNNKVINKINSTPGIKANQSSPTTILNKNELNSKGIKTKSNQNAIDKTMVINSSLESSSAHHSVILNPNQIQSVAKNARSNRIIFGSLNESDDDQKIEDFFNNGQLEFCLCIMVKKLKHIDPCEGNTFISFSGFQEATTTNLSTYITTDLDSSIINIISVNITPELLDDDHGRIGLQLYVESSPGISTLRGGDTINLKKKMQEIFYIYPTYKERKRFKYGITGFQGLLKFKHFQTLHVVSTVECTILFALTTPQLKEIKSKFQANNLEINNKKVPPEYSVGTFSLTLKNQPEIDHAWFIHSLVIRFTNIEDYLRFYLDCQSSIDHFILLESTKKIHKFMNDCRTRNETPLEYEMLPDHLGMIIPRKVYTTNDLFTVLVIAMKFPIQPSALRYSIDRYCRYALHQHEYSSVMDKIPSKGAHENDICNWYDMLTKVQPKSNCVKLVEQVNVTLSILGAVGLLTIPQKNRKPAIGMIEKGPSTYITFSANGIKLRTINADGYGQTYATSVCNDSVQPIWKQNFNVYIPATWFNSEDEFLLLTVWRKQQTDYVYARLVPDLRNDIIIGYVGIDLATIDTLVHHWFNIIDDCGHIQGYLEVTTRTTSDSGFGKIETPDYTIQRDLEKAKQSFRLYLEKKENGSALFHEKIYHEPWYVRKSRILMEIRVEEKQTKSEQQKRRNEDREQKKQLAFEKRINAVVTEIEVEEKDEEELRRIVARHKSAEAKQLNEQKKDDVELEQMEKEKQQMDKKLLKNLVGTIQKQQRENSKRKRQAKKELQQQQALQQQQSQSIKEKAIKKRQSHEKLPELVQQQPPLPAKQKAQKHQSNQTESEKEQPQKQQPSKQTNSEKQKPQKQSSNITQCEKQPKPQNQPLNQTQSEKQKPQKEAPNPIKSGKPKPEKKSSNQSQLEKEQSQKQSLKEMQSDKLNSQKQPLNQTQSEKQKPQKEPVKQIQPENQSTPKQQSNQTQSEKELPQKDALNQTQSEKKKRQKKSKQMPSVSEEQQSLTDTLMESMKSQWLPNQTQMHENQQAQNHPMQSSEVQQSSEQLLTQQLDFDCSDEFGIDKDYVSENITPAAIPESDPMDFKEQQLRFHEYRLNSLKEIAGTSEINLAEKPVSEPPGQEYKTLRKFVLKNCFNINEIDSEDRNTTAHTNTNGETTENDTGNDNSQGECPLNENHRMISADHVDDYDNVKKIIDQRTKLRNFMKDHSHPIELDEHLSKLEKAKRQPAIHCRISYNVDMLNNVKSESNENDASKTDILSENTFTEVRETTSVCSEMDAPKTDIVEKQQHQPSMNEGVIVKLDNSVKEQRYTKYFIDLKMLCRKLVNGADIMNTKLLLRKSKERNTLILNITTHDCDKRKKPRLLKSVNTKSSNANSPTLIKSLLTKLTSTASTEFTSMNSASLPTNSQDTNSSSVNAATKSNQTHKKPVPTVNNENNNSTTDKSSTASSNLLALDSNRTTALFKALIKEQINNASKTFDTEQDALCAGLPTKIIDLATNTHQFTPIIHEFADCTFDDYLDHIHDYHNIDDDDDDEAATAAAAYNWHGNAELSPELMQDLMNEHKAAPATEKLKRMYDLMQNIRDHDEIMLQIRANTNKHKAPRLSSNNFCASYKDDGITKIKITNRSTLTTTIATTTTYSTITTSTTTTTTTTTTITTTLITTTNAYNSFNYPTIQPGTTASTAINNQFNSIQVETGDKTESPIKSANNNNNNNVIQSNFIINENTNMVTHNNDMSNGDDCNQLADEEIYMESEEEDNEHQLENINTNKNNNIVTKRIVNNKKSGKKKRNKRRY